MNWQLALALCGLAATLLLVLPLWLVSLARRDVSIVDCAWAPLQLSTGVVYVMMVPEPGTRALPALLLVGAWALRLVLYIAVRNHGQPEDRRYQAIRARNQPYFGLKSLYLVFGLQAVLAWLVALPLLPIATSVYPLGWLDALAAALFVFGFLFESIGDWQLARFKREPANRGRVMDRGLWRYTRHPNYFGEFCCAWALYLFAIGADGWWTLFAPLLMSFLLLKVSGVALLEADIGTRRPGYAEYIARTNAFFPGPRRAAGPR